MVSCPPYSKVYKKVVEFSFTPTKKKFGFWFFSFMYLVLEYPTDRILVLPHT